MDYLIHIAILVSVYVMLAVSLNMAAGLAGILSVAHAAFYGLGAYAAALLSIQWGVPFWIILPIALALCMAAGLLIGAPTLHIRGDYFVVATFAFQVVAFNLFNNWTGLTGGPTGLRGVAEPAFLGWTITGRGAYLGLVLLLVALVCALAYTMNQSPYGRVLRGLREDEVFTESLGKPVFQYKLAIFAVSAGLAGLAGVFYAHYISFVDPSSFTLMESILILSMVILGGAGSYSGPILGAVILILLPEVLRFAGLPPMIAGTLRQLIYGLLLVLFMIYRPQGLIGEYAFGSGK